MEEMLKELCIEDESGGEAIKHVGVSFNVQMFYNSNNSQQQWPFYRIGMVVIAIPITRPIENHCSSHC